MIKGWDYSQPFINFRSEEMKRLFNVLSILLLITLLISCGKKDDYKLSIVAPSGAPAIAIANIAYNQKDDYSLEINKTADVLQASFLAAEKDIIIAPINLGATMYNKNGNYVLASVLTWGNLYIASRIEGFNIQTLNEKDVTFFGQNTINQFIVEKVLEHNNVKPSNITYLADTKLTQAQLISNPEAIALVAEPVLSVAKSKVDNITAISVQDLYNEMTNSGSYPQAACFIKKTTIEEHKKVVNNFINDLKESVDMVSSDTSTIAGYAEELEMGGAKAVLEKAIPNSNISYKTAKDSKEQIEALFTDALKYCGGKLPNEEFYYQK